MKEFRLKADLRFFAEDIEDASNKLAEHFRFRYMTDDDGDEVMDWDEMDKHKCNFLGGFELGPMSREGD